MEGYTFGSIGPHIVALNGEKILFSVKKYLFLRAAGFIDLNGERYLTKYSGCNSMALVNVKEVQLTEFTDLIPLGVRCIKSGKHWLGGLFNINDTTYINMIKGCDYFIYENDIKYTNDYLCLMSAHIQEYYQPNIRDELAALSPKFIKMKYFDRMICNMQLGLLFITYADEIYFCQDDWGNNEIIQHRSQQFLYTSNYENIFYVDEGEVNADDLVLVNYITGARLRLVDDYAKAHRPEGFANLYKFEDIKSKISVGWNDFGRIKLYSQWDIYWYTLFSTMNKDNKEIVFCITSDFELRFFEHEYPTQRSTKIAALSD